MAEPTLSTSVSRHTMSRRPVPAVPAVAGLDRDGEVLRWVAAAERYRVAFTRENALCDWLADAVGRHPEVPNPMIDSDEARARWDAVAGRLGLPADDARCARLHGLYDGAARTAFGIPAGALPGVLAKMRLGVAMVHERQARNDMPVDLDCLDIVLADLERIAAAPAWPGDRRDGAEPGRAGEEAGHG